MTTTQNPLSLCYYLLIIKTINIMKNVLFIISLFVSLTAFGQSNEGFRCGAATKKGTPCKNRVTEAGKKCYLHGGEIKTDVKLIASQCTAIAKSTKQQCRNKTTNPSGLCHVHNH